MSSGAPAGWYPDPDIIGHHRWWTGEGWSAVVIASNRVPANNQAPPGADVLPDRQPSRPPAWGGSGASGYVAPTIGNGSYTPPAIIETPVDPAPNDTAADVPSLPTFMAPSGAGAASADDDEAVPELPMFMPPGANANFTAATSPGLGEPPPDSAFGASVDPFGKPAPPPSAAPAAPAAPVMPPVPAPPPAGGPMAAPPPMGGPIAAPPPSGPPMRAPAPPPSAATRLAGPSTPAPAMRMAPGWYADPIIPGQFRYWDGTNWTNAVAGS